MVKKDFKKRQRPEFSSVDILSRADIFTLLSRQAKPVRLNKLLALLHCSELSMHAMQRRLQAMVRDGQLHVDAANRYRVTKNSQVVTATVTVHRNLSLSFTALDRKIDLSGVSVGHKQARRLMQHDRVCLRYFPGKHQCIDAIIVAIEQRAQATIVGQVHARDDGYVLESITPCTPSLLRLVGGGFQYEPDLFVKATVIDYPTDRVPATVQVAEVLGSLDSPDIIQSVMLNAYSLPFDFSEAALQAADAIDAQGIVLDKQRVDWRDKHFITIDGADAKDFDDAICIETMSDAWRVYVAISDVSHYIKAGSVLDEAAYLRATSVYMPNSVIPMLPSVLSDGLCSLCPDVDRLVKGVEIILSRRGKVMEYRFHRAVICSKRRLTYTQAHAIIQGKQSTDAWLAAMLAEAHAVYQLLEAKRHKRGALAIELPFAHYVYNQDNRIQSIQRQTRLLTHKIIEELMLLANELTAAFMLKSKRPTLYRNHDSPDVTRFKTLRPFLLAHGIAVDAEALEDLQPHTVQYVLDALAGLPHGENYVPLVLSTLAQACYEPKNKGHFGLAYGHYCHFTSPIRRYPDLLVHRALDQCLLADAGPILAQGITMRDAGEHCSKAERTADEAQKRSLQWLKCYFLRDKVGQSFQGTIVAVRNFGFFVNLADFMIDGLVHVSTLNDYYAYDDQSMSLVSRDRSVSYRIGQSVHICVQQVNVLTQTIDFVLL